MLTSENRNSVSVDLSILKDLLVRDIMSKYRESILGLIWSILTPLLMLTVYSFVFGVVFQARWAIGDIDSSGADQYALVMFVGLMVYSMFSEPILRSSGIIVGHPNYVKKVVFPLHLFPASLVLSSLLQSIPALFIWYFFFVVILGAPPTTALLYPVVVLPLATMSLGFTLAFSALGVYLRDLAQILAIVMSAVMFLSPIFYPSSALPQLAQDLLPFLNPVAIPIEEARRVLIYGDLPNWSALGAYSLAALCCLAAGAASFNALRKGFADVL